MSGGKRNRRLVGALALALAGAAVPASGAVPESLTIPLKVVQIPGVGTKVGIEVSLGGGAPRLYTFDTGSSGFYAAYNRRGGRPSIRSAADRSTNRTAATCIW